ncbi:MAG: helix-turn-helix domain-containing protein [Cecembia sp.]
MAEKENSDFVVLDNQLIGRNISLFRKLRDKKAIEVANFLDMKEATYTKYERGETKITIDLIQKLSDYFQVNPLLIIVSKPEQLLDKLQKSSSISDLMEDINKIKDYRQTSVQLLESIVSFNETIKRILMTIR